MSLRKYREKRDFSKTDEPYGKSHSGHPHLFIIQKHAATKLHYDFRMELEGVLKSWVIPKGPCLDPDTKRLAIQVEDHPIEYGSFEGIIPKNEYGGGTVMLWDKGRWESLDEDALSAFEKGHMRFVLDAIKLKGRWDLVRFQSEEDNSWFLIKYDDKYARSLKDYDITQELPNSAVSQQSMDEITEHYQNIWSGQNLKKRSVTLVADFIKANNLPSSPFPSFLDPQLATPVDTPPEADNWLHEVKWDGYRILAFKHHQDVQLLSRNHKSWTHVFQNITDEIKKLPVDHIVFDGEVVVLDKKNHSNFQLLQNAIHDKKHTVFIYYVFDLLYYHQWNLQSLPLIKRKNLLAEYLRGHECLRYSEHILGQGKEVFQKACQMGVEGILSKRVNSRYLSQRTKAWLKIKCIKRQEFVITGFSPPKGQRDFFSALYLGLYNEQNQLEFCGKVGTGFTRNSLKNIHEKLKKLIIPHPPFDVVPAGTKNAIWVKPELIAEIKFTNWTQHGKLRHPSFQGLRMDKKAKDVHREQPLKNCLHEHDAVLSNPQKMLYPKDKISKADVYQYYEEIADYILPFLQKRPLSLLRCPDSYDDCFYQKQFSQYNVKHIQTFPSKNKKMIYLTNKEGLLELIQMASLEIHPWGSTVDHIERPDIITIDLDPGPDVAWSNIVRAAVEIKDYLIELQLTSFVKTTGGKGLHVVIPILPEHSWDTIKRFTKLFVQFVARQHPERYTSHMAKAKRKGKIFLDYLRNQRGATAISPYSTRAKLHAPVAVPIHWDELTSNIEDTLFTLQTLPKRLRALKVDPWKNFWQIGQRLKINTHE
ncbi:DNA ligase D [Legionella israelensis]|uniref:DNA ligase (ATP) n=1 Tax=Legionella israelensis TaxID=454 RepID=A0A0W0V2A7_9GAMM|nr:DNA ligase D [Legionella israelensis]KTD14239.1 DNA ligase D [Legionella israelensis]QBS10080.1 DNA ligase D [Legionella israelensis]SCX97338.1 bifunctional non-homologous end joining protein LigD [Legionella israelensis DSM 19235]STX59665.1 Putative DNA ligase-like protein Rv0938/MT0965 [Legionella israelensis]